MNIIRARHSVRQYKDLPIEKNIRQILDDLVTQINKDNNLHIQILYDEPDCFNRLNIHYGKIKGCNNYISLVGPKSDKLDETIGYYGELLVLKVQELGLNSCWVYLTHGESKAVVNQGEKEACIISIGYGLDQGKDRRSKSVKEVSNYQDGFPDWFRLGIEATLLAPTAINQQKYYFEYNDGEVSAKVKGLGFCTKIDLGIVKYHFERVPGIKVK